MTKFLLYVHRKVKERGYYLSNNPPKSLAEFTSSLIGLDYDLIREETKSHVCSFIEKAIKEKSNESILLVGRKSSLLFESVFKRLTEKGYGIAILRPLNDASYWITGPPLQKKVSLVVDCINTGDEIKRVFEFICKGCEVTSIYCYACNIDTYDSLIKEEKFKNIPIIVAFKLDNKESQPFFRRVQVYYQSLLHPVDSDHAYDIYQPGSSLSAPAIRKIVQHNCRKIFGSQDLIFEKDTRLCLPKDMDSYTLDLTNINPEKGSWSPKMKDFLDLMIVDFPFMRLKTHSEKGRTRFSIMSCFPLRELDVSCLMINKSCDVTEKSKCYHHIVKSSGLSKSLRDQMLCPLCVANYIERSMLNQISSVVLETITPWQREFGITLQKYDPIIRNL